MMSIAIHTIGHGNRTSERLIQCVESLELDALIDIRANPYSPHFPQFNQDALRVMTESLGMIYHWAGRQLGGQRQLHSHSQHSGLQSDELRAYADYMEKEVFRLSVLQLIGLTRMALS